MSPAVMLVLIWTSAPTGQVSFGIVGHQHSITTPALYFDSFAACESAIPVVEAQVKAINPKAQVSARCYEEAYDPRG